MVEAAGSWWRRPEWRRARPLPGVLVSGCCSTGAGTGTGKGAAAPLEKMSPGSVHRRASGPGADAVWDDAVLKVWRNWLRKASIGSSGAWGPGSSPSCQCQGAICLNTDGSRATIEITTAWLAPGLVIGAPGCSSPSRMSTRLGSLTSVTHDVRACIEYSIDLAKASRSFVAFPKTAVALSVCAIIGSYIEPLPTLLQGTMVGNGTNGVCEESRSISAITGLCP